MVENIKIAVDGMGGDNAPGEIVKGCVEAIKEKDGIKIFLTGRPEALNTELSRYEYDKERIEIIPASEIISTEEPPVAAIKSKKDSSLVVAQMLVKKGEADAFISAGSTGALLAGGMLLIGRQKGVQRAPLGTLIPTVNGVSFLLDCGANVDARASHLIQFAKMGSIYMEHVVGIKNPRVAIVNIGIEEEKGNALVKETYRLLKACTGINFTGNIEAREIAHGGADVIVCEGFVGNVILKMYEGTASALIGIIKKGLKSTVRSKIGAALAMPALKNTLKSFEVSHYGGAPLLGLKGLAVKTHGTAKSREIKNTIFQCHTFMTENINAMIGKSFSREDTKKEEE